jgi:hypothetical protein
MAKDIEGHIKLCKICHQWVELVPIPNKEANTVAKALWDNWICKFGFYRQSVSDGGREFDNKVLQELNDLMASKHHIISPYSPSVNGIIEHVHRSLGGYIKSFCNNRTTDWLEYLPALTFSLNTKIHRSTKFSPYFITYGEHPSFPWTPHDTITYSESEIADRVKMLQYAQQLCHKNDLDARAASKRSFDVKAKNSEVSKLVMKFYYTFHHLHPARIQNFTLHGEEFIKLLRKLQNGHTW